MRSGLWLALALMACTQTSTITDNVCGNGVLEAGEDCDAPGDSACTATCRIACTVADRGSACTGLPDGQCCPTGSQCGVDGVCHAPSGTVSSELVEPYDMTYLVVADVDGDHIADVIGVNNSNVEVRYGDPSTPLARNYVAPSPVVTGGVGFGDLTGDGRIDIVIPTAGGLFAFETSSGVPEPIPFPAKTDAGMTHLRVATTPTAIITLDFVATANAIELGSVGRDFVTPGTLLAKPCGSTQANTPRGRQLHPFSDGGRTLVPIQYFGGAVCIASVDGTTSGQLIPTTTPGFAGTRPDTIGETFLASVLGNPCPDLLVSVETTAVPAVPQTIVFPGTGSPGTCAVSTATFSVLPGVAFAAIDLAITGAPRAVVTTSGFIDPKTGAVLAAPSRSWTYAIVTDLDHDGLDDLITTGTSTDVEAIFQKPGTTIPELTDFEIPTTDVAAFIATGDFDGDGNGDIAIGTVDATATDGAADLEIAWGGASGGFEVTDVGTFSEPHDLVATNLVDESLPPGFDQFDDLIVAQGGNTPTNPADPTLLIAEYGSTSRGLTAPFVFESRFGATLGTPLRSIGRGAVIGNFGTGGGTGAFAVFSAKGNSAPFGYTSVGLTATSYGDFTASVDAPFSSCGPADSAGDVPFCVDNAHYTRIERTSSLDVVLATRSDVDAGALTQCMEYATTATSILTPVSCAALATVTPGDPNAADEMASLVDVSTPRLADNDGTNAHLFLGRSTTKDAESAVLWTLATDAGGTPHLSDPIDFNAELGAIVAAGDPAALTQCMDGVEIELGTRTVDGVIYGAAGNELVLACAIGDPGMLTTQIWARYAAADPSQPPSYTLLYNLGQDQIVHVRDGDVNGDGLTDILYTFGASGVGKVEVHVLLQCDTHQTGCQGGT
jgi:hypothetical protein